MNIALVTLTKPIEGSGDGLTEYTYQLYSTLKERHKVDLVYALGKTKRNDIGGLVHANTLFKNRIAVLAGSDYDIVHVTHQDIGFASKILKNKGSNARIITTIYDLIRYKTDMHKGFLQRSYNSIIRRSIRDAVKYSDFIIFGAEQTKQDAEKRFGSISNSAVVNPGIKNRLLETPIPKKTKDHNFTIGYLGALAYHKNVKMILEAANILQSSKYEFLIYGTGIEHDNLMKYKEAHNLCNVTLKGFASETELTQIYDSFDVFTFPSMYEGLAYPPLEALARGIPVIINKNGSGIVPSEAQKHVYKTKNAREMAGIIKMIKEKGWDENRRKAAIKYAKKFTWANASNDTYKIYLKLLKK